MLDLNPFDFVWLLFILILISEGIKTRLVLGRVALSVINLLSHTYIYPYIYFIPASTALWHFLHCEKSTKYLIWIKVNSWMWLLICNKYAWHVWIVAHKKGTKNYFSKCQNTIEWQALRPWNKIVKKSIKLTVIFHDMKNLHKLAAKCVCVDRKKNYEMQ